MSWDLLWRILWILVYTQDGGIIFFPFNKSDKASVLLGSFSCPDQTMSYLLSQKEFHVHADKRCKVHRKYFATKIHMFFSKCNINVQIIEIQKMSGNKSISGVNLFCSFEPIYFTVSSRRHDVNKQVNQQHRQFQTPQSKFWLLQCKRFMAR